jgi:N-methylhydantoinase A
MKALMVRALRHLRDDGFSGDPISVVTFEMRYLGQNYSIEIPVPLREEGVDAQGLRAVFDSFHRRHRQLYGYSIEQEVIEITDFNATAIGLIPKPDLPRIRPTGAVSPRSHRLVYFEEAGGFVECSIYERADICADTVMEGPAIIEEAYSLTLLPPHQRMNADEWGNLYITRARTPSGLLEKIG